MPGQQPNTSIPSLWLFALAILPYGVGVNFVQTTAPFLLGKAGTPVHTIATVSAISWCPLFLSFLWAPLVDLGWKRRNLVVLSGFCTAAVLFLATLVLPSRNGPRLPPSPRWPSRCAPSVRRPREA